MCGLTDAHGVFLVCKSLAWKVIMMHPHCCRTLVLIVSTRSMELKVSRHSFWYEVESFMCWLLPYLNRSNLFTLNFILFIYYHLFLGWFRTVYTSVSFLMAGSSLFQMKMRIHGWVYILFFMSPIRMRENIGPGTVPCGTYLSSGTQMSWHDLLWSPWFYHQKNHWIHVLTFSVNTKLFQFIGLANGWVKHDQKPCWFVFQMLFPSKKANSFNGILPYNIWVQIRWLLYIWDK